MKNCKWRRRLVVFMAVGFLAGCNSGSQFVASQPPKPNASEPKYVGNLTAHTPYLNVNGIGGNVARVSGKRSWMDPDAKERDLLYVSNLGYTPGVNVYSYPEGKLKGVLTGFTWPQGLCVDKLGNVWITDKALATITEYAHGAKEPIARLNTPGLSPYGCSVNLVTGDLAVTSFYSFTGPGSLLVYRKARGKPTSYSNPRFAIMYFPAYDKAGNLFVDGVDSGSSFLFAELAKGKKALKAITLNQNIGFPGGVEWDGRYVAVGDQSADVIYQFSINGNKGVKTGSTLLKSSDDVLQFWIQGDRLIGPNNDEAEGGTTVMFWNYPKGGSPTKTITGLYNPVGAAVSVK